MLEKSFRLTFCLKSPQKVTSHRLIYLRITVDGIAKKTLTKQKWTRTEPRIVFNKHSIFI